MFQNHLDLEVTIIDRSKEMLDKLKGVVDPEHKRKIIGAEFINAFRKFRDHLADRIGRSAMFLVQVSSPV